MPNIETMAIYYHAGTPEKNCAICYAVESRISTGPHCLLNDLPTSSAGWCGMGIVNVKPVESKPVEQKELF